MRTARGSERLCCSTVCAATMDEQTKNDRWIDEVTKMRTVWVPYQMTAVLITIEMVLSCLSLWLWLLLHILQCFLSMVFFFLSFFRNFSNSNEFYSAFHFLVSFYSIFWEKKSKMKQYSLTYKNIIKFIKIFNGIQFLLTQKNK